MKNKIIILLVALSTFFMGCNNEYEAPKSFSDIGFMTSLGTLKILQIGVNDYLTFADLSQGVEKHSWSIQKGDFFLKGPIDRRELNLDRLIINAGDTVSNEDFVNVYFKKPGNRTVRLYNVFKDSVTFRGNNGTEDYIMPSKKVGNKWVIDTTFAVKVYDTILPSVVVKHGDVTLDITSKDTVEVEAGDFLKFTDNTTQGEPTARNWYVRNKQSGVNIASSNAQEVDVVLKKIGVFVAGITVSRSGENIPGDSQTTQFAFPIKVIPSSKPFGLSGTIKELEDETIQIPFNGEFNTVSGQESFFDVKVNGTSFDIESVAVSSTDETVLNIKLSDPIYRPDVITVSLLAGHSLESTDERIPLLFTDEPVVMHDVNLLPADVANSNLFTPWWRNSTHVELSTEQVAVGTKSVKLTVLPGELSAEAGFKFENSDIISLESGAEYTVKFKVYIDSANSPNLALNTSLWLLNDWGWNANQTLSEIETDKWVEVTRTYTRAPLDVVQIWLRLLAGGDNTAETTIYMDDFFLQEIETRP